VEALAAIDLLLRSRLEHQIRPLVRSTYELFLNFYLDWLSPEQVGLVMQSVALLARTDSKAPEYGDLEEKVKRVFGGLANLCRNAAEKGRLSPLGSEMHERIYSGLSPIVHQDFGVAHEYGAALESGRPEKLGRKELLEIIRWLDIITAATIVRILDDVGAMTLMGRGSGPDLKEG
jgi:hypothetical protein